jgi:hypothetical protein
MIEPLQMSFVVNCRAEHAFAVWTARTSGWWPIRHTVTCEPGLQVVFEGRRGGWERLGARGPGRRDADRAGWAGLLPHFEAACTPR